MKWPLIPRLFQKDGAVKTQQTNPSQHHPRQPAIVAAAILGGAGMFSLGALTFGVLKWGETFLRAMNDAVPGVQTLAIMFGAFFAYTLWSTTADALQQLRREHVNASRPQLRLRQLSFGTNSHQEPFILYTLANTGQSRARVIKSNLTIWQPVKGEELPGRPPYSDATDSLGQITIVAGQDYLGEYKDAPDSMDLLFADVAGNKHTDTMLLGYVVYLDDNDTPRRLGFCRKRTERSGLRFTAVEDPDYEFFY